MSQNMVPKSSTDAKQNPVPGDDSNNPAAEKARRAWAWLTQYWQALFSLSFDKYMIIQMLPILYGMMLFAIGTSIIYLIIEAFASGSHWRGFFYLFFAGPLTFVVLASMLRALLELYIVIFRVAENVDELMGIRDTVDRLSGLQDTVDQMASLTRRIPFWKVIMGKGSPSARKLSAERRESELKAGDTKPPRDGKPGA